MVFCVFHNPSVSLGFLSLRNLAWEVSLNNTENKTKQNTP